MSKEPKLINSGATDAMLAQVREERARQDARWGVQDIPILGVDPGPDILLVAMRDESVARCQYEEAERAKRLTFLHILREELAEVVTAAARGDLAAARTELLQVAAVAVQAAEAITRVRHTDPRTRAQDSWLAWDDEDIECEFAPWPAKHASVPGPRLDGSAESTKSAGANLAGVTKTMQSMIDGLTDKERALLQERFANAPRPAVDPDKLCDRLRPSQDKLIDIVRPACVVKIGHAPREQPQLGSRWSVDMSDPSGDGFKTFDGHIVAVETNHVLFEFETLQNRWGGPERRWFPSATCQRDSVFLMPAPAATRETAPGAG